MDTMTAAQWQDTAARFRTMAAQTTSEVMRREYQRCARTATRNARNAAQR